MFMQPEAKEWIQILDNSDSYIHQEAFKNLKDTLIRNLTTEYWVDDCGTAWGEVKEWQQC